MAGRAPGALASASREEVEGMAVSDGAGSVVDGGRGVSGFGVPAADFFGVTGEGLAVEAGGAGAGTVAAGWVAGSCEFGVAAAGATGAGGTEFVAVVVTGGTALGAFVAVVDLLCAKYWMPAMAEAATMMVARPAMSHAGRKRWLGGGDGTI